MPFDFTGNAPARDERGLVRRSQADRDLIGEVAGGLVLGAHADPILGFVMDKIVSAFPGTDPEVFRQMERELDTARRLQIAQDGYSVAVVLNYVQKWQTQGGGNGKA